MSNEVRVVWTGEERTVPYLGHFQPGKEYTVLLTEQVQKFIDDGHARLADQKRTRGNPKE